MFLGLRTVIYPDPDLDAAKRWYTDLLGVAPYFDQPFYVGFNVGGYELGLDPDGSVEEGPRAYWGVADADVAFQWLLSHGARERSGVQEVGDGIRVASVLDPAGSVFGIIENPHFRLDETGTGEGPGR
jgi:catechol 2,3-dioxygenase-like lactoylglutathione lyase family enzyme